MSIVNPAPVSAVRAADPGDDTRLTMAFPALRRGVLSTLQVNLGYRCNQPLARQTPGPPVAAP